MCDCLQFLKEGNCNFVVCTMTINTFIHSVLSFYHQTSLSASTLSVKTDLFNMYSFIFQLSKHSLALKTCYSLFFWSKGLFLSKIV